MEMKTTEILLERTHKLWNEYKRHPFVLALRGGTLDRELFRNYIIEDTLYLYDYARVFAIGMAKATCLEDAELFASYIAVMHGEMNVHKGYLQRLNISELELSLAKPKLNNIAYTSYMLRVAYEETSAEILAAILPCAYSYEIIAKSMVSESKCTSDNFYGDWISSYASYEYSKGNKALLDALDRLTVGYTEEKLSHLADIFEICSRFELEFWNASADGRL